MLGLKKAKKNLLNRHCAEKKKDKEQSTHQITEIPLNDDKIPIEVSTRGESTGDGEDDHLGNTIPTSYEMDHMSSEEAATEFKSNLELQAEEGTREIVRSLQKQVSHLQTKCFQLNQLAQESAMWEEKCTHLQRELNSYKNKIIKGDTQIIFGSELLPIKMEYNFRTNQFSAGVSEEAIEWLLEVLRREQ